MRVYFKDTIYKSIMKNINKINGIKITLQIIG